MEVWAIIFVSLIIFLISIIIFGVAEIFASSPSNPIPNCILDSDCPQKQVCQSGLCKIPLGGKCNNLGDCVTGADICLNGICTFKEKNGPGSPCPCQSGYSCINGYCLIPNGTTCNSNDQCISGICMNGVCNGTTGCTGATGATSCSYSSNSSSSLSTSSCSYSTQDSYSYSTSASRTITSRDPEALICYTDEECPEGFICSPRTISYFDDHNHLNRLIKLRDLPGENAYDVTNYKGKIYILLEGGDIIKVEDQCVKRRYSNDLPFERIFVFADRFYGLCDGRLYCGNKNNNEWDWKSVNIKTGITHISLTYDGNYLWVETEKEGYLYTKHLEVADRIKKRFNKRSYGNNKTQYIDFYDDYVVTSDRQKYPPGPSYIDVDGQVCHLDEEVWGVRIFNFEGRETTFFIFQRGCIELN